MGFVYFIYEKDTNNCKIGHSIEPIERITCLQTGNSSELDIHRTIKTDNPKLLENFFHLSLKLFHIRGEWYMIHKNQIDILIKNTDFKEIKPKLKPKTKKYLDKSTTNI